MRVYIYIYTQIYIEREGGEDYAVEETGVELAGESAVELTVELAANPPDCRLQRTRPPP